MSLNLSTLEQKLAAIERTIDQTREAMRSGAAPTDEEVAHYHALKAISVDIRARQALPRNEALGALEQELARMKASIVRGRPGGYDHGKMIGVANVLISKWPIVRQALERFKQEELADD